MLHHLFATRKRPHIPYEHVRERISIDLSGSVLTADALPHNDYEGFTRGPVPASVNIYDDDHYYSEYYNEDELPEWRRSGEYIHKIHDRNWDFKGPFWREQPYGFMSFIISLVRVHGMPREMSCFNPAHFEQVALRSAYQSTAGSPFNYPHKAPCAWRLVPQNSGQTGIYFEVLRHFTKEKPLENAYQEAYRDHFLMIPIDDHYYVRIRCIYFGYAPVDDCLRVMGCIRDSVLNSIQLNLGEYAAAQLQRAKQHWPHAKASTHRDPEYWTYPECRRGKEGEEDIVLIKPGSPRPPFVP